MEGRAAATGKAHLFNNVYPNVVSDLATLDLEEGQEELPEEGAEGGDIYTHHDGEEGPSYVKIARLE